MHVYEGSMWRYVWLNALNVLHVPQPRFIAPPVQTLTGHVVYVQTIFYSDWTALPSSVLSIQKLGDCVKSIHLSKTRLVYETTEPVLATFQTYRYVIQPENLEHWKTWGPFHKSRRETFYEIDPLFPDPKRKVQCKKRQKQSRPFVPCYVQ